MGSTYKSACVNADLTQVFICNKHWGGGKDAVTFSYWDNDVFTVESWSNRHNKIR